MSQELTFEKRQWFESLPLETGDCKILWNYRTCECGEVVNYDGDTPALRVWINTHFKHRNKIDYGVLESSIIGGKNVN